MLHEYPQLSKKKNDAQKREISRSQAFFEVLAAKIRPPSILNEM